MPIFAIYDKNDKFIIAFPTREEAENYGKVVLGLENGWEYSIKEKFIHNYRPLTQPITTPYTPPIPLKTTPYEPNIWCDVKAPKVTEND